MKIIALIVVIAAAIWVYFNVDFSNFKSNTVNSIKQEKTIFGVSNSREQNRNETKEVLDNNF